MICSAEYRFLAMIARLPNKPIIREYPHTKWTGFGGQVSGLNTIQITDLY